METKKLLGICVCLATSLGAAEQAVKKPPELTEGQKLQIVKLKLAMKEMESEYRNLQAQLERAQRVMPEIQKAHAEQAKQLRALLDGLEQAQPGWQIDVDQPNLGWVEKPPASPATSEKGK